MDKIKELTDFYMWMQENDYDHNIRARVERKAEMYLKNETYTDANNVLAAGLSLIQAKDAAMIEGKKIRHRFFMDDEYIYYKNGCWFTQDGYQMPDVYWLNAQEKGWDDSWSVVS